MDKKADANCECGEVKILLLMCNKIRCEMIYSECTDDSCQRDSRAVLEPRDVINTEHTLPYTLLLLVYF